MDPGTYTENPDFHGKDVRVQSTGGAAATRIDGAGGKAVSIGPAGALVGFTVTGALDFFGAAMEVFGAGTLVQGNVFAHNPCRAIDMVLPAEAAPVVVNNTIVDNPVGLYVSTFGSDVYRNNAVVGNQVGYQYAGGNPPVLVPEGVVGGGGEPPLAGLPAARLRPQGRLCGDTPATNVVST